MEVAPVSGARWRAGRTGVRTPGTRQRRRNRQQGNPHGGAWDFASLCSGRCHLARWRDSSPRRPTSGMQTGVGPATYWRPKSSVRYRPKTPEPAGARIAHKCGTTTADGRHRLHRRCGGSCTPARRSGRLPSAIQEGSAGSCTFHNATPSGPSVLLRGAGDERKPQHRVARSGQVRTPRFAGAGPASGAVAHLCNGEWIGDASEYTRGSGQPIEY